jgi:hypothetical protein
VRSMLPVEGGGESIVSSRGAKMCRIHWANVGSKTYERSKS